MIANFTLVLMACDFLISATRLLSAFERLIKSAWEEALFSAR